MRRRRILIEMEIETTHPIDEDLIEAALEHTGAADALGEAMDCNVRLFPVWNGNRLARADRN
jgi:hypothetical protein